MACIAAKPVVDGLESEAGDRLQVVRLNVHEPVGREVGARLGWEYTPTFILFDPEGRELWRAVGALDPDAVRSRLSTH